MAMSVLVKALLVDPMPKTVVLSTGIASPVGVKFATPKPSANSTYRTAVSLGGDVWGLQPPRTWPSLMTPTAKPGRREQFITLLMKVRTSFQSVEFACAQARRSGSRNRL
jgi:hypothetical protein